MKNRTDYIHEVFYNYEDIERGVQGKGSAEIGARGVSELDIETLGELADHIAEELDYSEVKVTGYKTIKGEIEDE